MAKTLIFSKNKQFFDQKGAKMGNEYTITIAKKQNMAMKHQQIGRK